MKILIAIAFLFFSLQAVGQDRKLGECFTHEPDTITYCFAADSITYDSMLGDSYRILLISTADSDSLLNTHYLEVNLAADFSYQFNTENIASHGFLILQGAQHFYLYDTERSLLSDAIKPTYNDCPFSDMQGSYISNLKINWNGTVLLLTVRECGLRTFDIRDIRNIKEI